MPGGEYDRSVFINPQVCRSLRLDVHKLTFVDFSFTIAYWLNLPPLP